MSTYASNLGMRILRTGVDSRFAREQMPRLKSLRIHFSERRKEGAKAGSSLFERLLWSNAQLRQHLEHYSRTRWTDMIEFTAVARESRSTESAQPGNIDSDHSRSLGRNAGLD